MSGTDDDGVGPANHVAYVTNLPVGLQERNRDEWMRVYENLYRGTTVEEADRRTDPLHDNLRAALKAAVGHEVVLTP